MAFQGRRCEHLRSHNVPLFCLFRGGVSIVIRSVSEGEAATPLLPRLRFGLRFTSLRLSFRVFTAIALEGHRTVLVCNCRVL